MTNEVKISNPFREEGQGKLIYHARNVHIAKAEEIWPNLDPKDAFGVVVLVGESFVHDEWHPLRSSQILGVNGVDVETRNSVYRVVDGSISVANQ